MQTEYLAGEPIPEIMSKLLYFVNERETVRINRELGKSYPWTEDKILQEYRFCNMRRRDDRVSDWLIRNLYAPYKDHPLLWMMPVVARWINWPPTIAMMLQHDAWEQDELHDDWFYALGDEIDDIVLSGGKAWTGAYMITARTIPDGRGKGNWIANSTLKPVWQNRKKFEEFFSRAPQYRTVEEAISLFKGQFNHGTFMAGQIVADWTYTHLLDQAPDLYTYAPIGPGSTRGLNRLYDRGLEKPIKQEQFNAELIHVLSEINKLVVFLGGQRLTLHDCQNAMCETDKFLRLENGGRVRAKYQPEVRY